MNGDDYLQFSGALEAVITILERSGATTLGAEQLSRGRHDVGRDRGAMHDAWACGAGMSHPATFVRAAAPTPIIATKGGSLARPVASLLDQARRQMMARKANPEAELVLEGLPGRAADARDRAGRVHPAIHSANPAAESARMI